MQNIADSLGVSKNAVSLALNGKPGISESLREQVLTTASNIGYFYRNQKNNKNNNLLLIMDDEHNEDSEFFYALIFKTLRYAKNKNYNVLVANISNEFQKQLVIPRIYYEIKAEGVLFIGGIKKQFIQMFINMGIPNVLMVQHFSGLQTDNVISNNEDGGYLLTKYLINLGHKKIGYIADVSMFDSFNKRFQGYKKALDESNIPVGNYDLSFYSFGKIPSINTLGPQIEKIINMTDKPTAWFCGNDHTAIILINEFRKNGIRVPKDISVVGFDAISSAKVFHPEITTYDSRIDLIAKHSVDLIINHIENGHANWNPVILSVIGNLIIGNSACQIDS